MMDQFRWRSRFFASYVAILVGTGTVAHAAESASTDNTWERGSPAPRFTLKALNLTKGGSGQQDAAERSEGNSNPTIPRYVSLDDYVGVDANQPQKAVLISFFATYCAPCVREVPFLADLQQIYGSQGLQVLLISIDTEQDKMNEARDVVVRAQGRFPLLSDRFNLVAKRYRIAQLPAMFVIDSAGQIQSTFAGDERDTARQLHDELRRAMGISASTPIAATLLRHLE